MINHELVLVLKKESRPRDFEKSVPGYYYFLIFAQILQEINKYFQQL